MSTRPNPLSAKVDRKSGKLAIVSLSFDESSAAACCRCQVCTAKPTSDNGEFTCSNEMPTSAVPAFIWGSRVDRSTSAPPPAPTEASAPAKPRRSRRRPSVKTIDKVAADLRAAIASEKSAETSPDPHPDDPKASDAAGHRMIHRTSKAANRLKEAVVAIHGDGILDADACDAVGIEVENHYIITIPPLAMDCLEGGRTLTIAISKDAMVRLAESKPK